MQNWSEEGLHGQPHNLLPAGVMWVCTSNMWKVLTRVPTLIFSKEVPEVRSPVIHIDILSTPST
jgi:hypothetical protein